MLICGHCGGLVKSLSDLAVHLRCEEKPLPLVVVENTSTNTEMLPLPTLEECEKEVQRCLWQGSTKGTSFNITKCVYDFICRQQRHS